MTQVTQEAVPKILISDIIIDEDTQVRLDLFIGLDELTASISENGLREPIEVRLEQDKVYLVTGRRRLESCKSLGWKEIPYKLTPVSKKEAINYTIAENLARNNLTPMEEARAFKVALNLGWTVSELAVKHGKRPEWIKDRLALLETDKKVQELVHIGKLGVETVKKAIADKPKEIQSDIAKQVVEEQLDVRTAQQEANRIERQYNEQRKFLKQVEEGKFKTCPTCKKPAMPRPEFSEPGSGWAQCREEMYGLGENREKHVWNLTTGKTLAQQQAEQNKARAEGRGGVAGPKKKFVTYAFRYNVPVSIVQQAILNEAVALAQKRLKKGSKHELKLDVDDFRIQVDTWEGTDTLTFDLEDGSAFNKLLAQVGSGHFEPKKYEDRGGNVTKVTPSHTSGNQDTINVRNGKFKKWLDSLPEVAKYKKTHKLK